MHERQATEYRAKQEQVGYSVKRKSKMEDKKHTPTFYCVDSLNSVSGEECMTQCNYCFSEETLRSKSKAINSAPAQEHTPTEENILANKHDPHVAYAMAKAREILVDGSLQWQIETIATLLLRANINSYALNSAPQVNEWTDADELRLFKVVDSVGLNESTVYTLISRLKREFTITRKGS